MILQINPPIPLETPKGRGLAHFVVDYGPEHHLMWTVFLDANGECWTFSNPNVRAIKNITMGRTSVPDSGQLADQSNVSVWSNGCHQPPPPNVDPLPPRLNGNHETKS